MPMPEHRRLCAHQKTQPKSRQPRPFPQPPPESYSALQSNSEEEPSPSKPARRRISLPHTAAQHARLRRATQLPNPQPPAPNSPGTRGPLKYELKNAPAGSSTNKQILLRPQDPAAQWKSRETRSDRTAPPKTAASAPIPAATPKNW